MRRAARAVRRRAKALLGIPLGDKDDPQEPQYPIHDFETTWDVYIRMEALKTLGWSYWPFPEGVMNTPAWIIDDLLTLKRWIDDETAKLTPPKPPSKGA